MTIGGTQLFTRLRTWTVVVGLSAPVIALGALLGGAFVWLFSAIAVTMNLVGYLYSDRSALRAVHAQPLAEAQAPEVHAAIRELATRAGIRTPRLYLMRGDQANAFAIARNEEHATVAVTVGLLVNLPLDQIRGVLAHELSHIKNRDILVFAAAATIAGAISAIVSVLELSFLFGEADDDLRPFGLVGSLIAILLAPLGAMLLQRGVSRQREYLADATAARLLGSGAPLADALEEIERDRASLAVNPVNAPMYVADPLGGQSRAILFSTHPPVGERIRRLRGYDERAPRRASVARPYRPARFASFNARKRQSVLGAELRHALKIEVQAVVLAELGELRRLELRTLHRGGQLVEEPLESSRGDDLEDPARSVVGIPEGVPLPARFEGQLAGLRIDHLVAEQRAHPSLEHEAVLVLPGVAVRGRDECARRDRVLDEREASAGLRSPGHKPDAYRAEINRLALMGCELARSLGSIESSRSVRSRCRHHNLLRSSVPPGRAGRA